MPYRVTDISTPSHRPWLAALAALLIAACGSDGSDSSDPDGGGDNGQPDASLEDVPDRTTYIDSLVIPDVVNRVPVCCVDFGERSKDFIEDADNNVDNALAIIANDLSAFLDFQEVLDDTIQGGDQVILLNHVGLASADDSFRMDALVGSFAEGTTYAEASTGTGSFLVDPSSYDGSGDPVISLTSTIAGGAVDAGPSDFTFQLPFGDVTLDVTIKEAQLTGDATLSETAASYTSGTLGGYILVDELFAALNGYASTCTCLGLAGDLFVKGPGGWDSDCVPGATAACPEDPSCATIAGADLFPNGEACTLIPNLIENNADIDLNDDPAEYEGLSVGFQWTGQNASLSQ